MGLLVAVTAPRSNYLSGSNTRSYKKIMANLDFFRLKIVSFNEIIGKYDIQRVYFILEILSLVSHPSPCPDQKETEFENLNIHTSLLILLISPNYDGTLCFRQDLLSVSSINFHVVFAFLQLLSIMGKIQFWRDGREGSAEGGGVPAVPKVIAGKSEKN